MGLPAHRGAHPLDAVAGFWRVASRMNTVVVAAAVLIEQSRVLLTQRKAGTHLAGAWEFPGGKVEPGEDPREALRRELAEELGIDATAGEIVDVTFHRYEDAAKAVLLLFFEATRDAESPIPRPSTSLHSGGRRRPTSTLRVFPRPTRPCCKRSEVGSSATAVRPERDRSPPGGPVRLRCRPI